MQRLLAWRPGIEKAPLLAMAMVFGLVAIASQKEMAMVPLSKISLGSRVVNALVVSGGYLAKALWPAGLSAIYLPPSGGYPAGRVVLSAVFLAGLVLMAAAAARRRPYLTTGLLWFLVALVPVNGMLQAGFQSMADRFAYVPLMGIYLLVVWGAWDLAPAWRFRGAAAAAVSGLVITVLLLAARHQVGFWHDSASLFGRALSVTPDNWVARNNLAAAYLEQGNNRGAIANYQEVIKVKPNLPKARFNLGRALLAAGEPGQAEIQFRETIRLIPDLPEAHLHLGIVLAIQGKLDEAITALEEALRLKPDSVDVHYNLALALQSRGRPDEAAAHYREALRLRPDHPLARRQLEGIQGRGRPGT